jgi:hypothetical protein
MATPGLASDIGKSAVVVVVIELQRGFSMLVARPVFAIHQQNVGPAIVVVIDEGTTRSHGLGQILFSECAVIVDETNAGLRSDIAKLDLLRSCGCGQENQDKKKLYAHLSRASSQADSVSRATVGLDGSRTRPYVT